VDQEIVELVKIGERDIAALRMSDTGGFVREEDSPALFLWYRCKEACDVFVVPFEFSFSVKEGEARRPQVVVHSPCVETF
jgi:hypothetical protein